VQIQQDASQGASQHHCWVFSL